MNDLSTSIPNFFVAEAQIDSNISIRGVQTGSNKGFEQSVAMYFDGISYGRSQLIRTPLVDLERVEVLRGPQPTLFGKNAIAVETTENWVRASGDVEGFEVDGRYLVAEGIELYASAASLDDKFTDFKDSQCAYGEAPTNGIYCDRSGATAPFAPETSANAGIDITHNLGNGYVIDANVNVDYSSEYFITSNLDANIVENGYTKYAAQLGFGSEDGKWRVSIVGENLGDERIRLVGGTIPLARTFVSLASGGALDGIAYDAIYARPRNVAIKFDYNF